MDPVALIESYVEDVIRRLPRKQRGDVGFELRSLLNEELDAKAIETGRSADEAMALTLLRDFGSPAVVAGRYRPSGFTIIEPAQSQAFTLWALSGVAVQWAVTLPSVFIAPEAFAGQTLARFGAWWTHWGIGAFWFPGFLVVVAIIAGWIRHRWPRSVAWTPRRVLDRDRISRPVLALGLGAWAAGAAIWIAMPWYGPHLPGVLPAVFAFDEGFLRTRGPWLLVFWAGHYLVHVAALVEGRWRGGTRRAGLAFDVSLCGLLAWFVIAGPIFRSRATDDAAKVMLAVIVLVSLVQVALKLYRGQGPIRGPQGLTNGSAGNG